MAHNHHPYSLVSLFFCYRRPRRTRWICCFIHFNKFHAQSYTRLLHMTTHVFSHDFTYLRLGCGGVLMSLCLLTSLIFFLMLIMLHTASSHDFTYLRVAWGVWERLWACQHIFDATLHMSSLLDRTYLRVVWGGCGNVFVHLLTSLMLRSTRVLHDFTYLRVPQKECEEQTFECWDLELCLPMAMAL